MSFMGVLRVFDVRRRSDLKLTGVLGQGSGQAHRRAHVDAPIEPGSQSSVSQIFLDNI